MSRARVFVGLEPYITDVIVQAVTRLGTYIDKSQARHLIGQGLVTLDGVRVRTCDTLVELGEHFLTMDGRQIIIDVHGMPNE
jgi:hypothetical protein